MAKQILFLRKNRIDLSFDSVTITATEGNEFVDYLRNRSMRSGWSATGTTDAANTQITVMFAGGTPISDIILNSCNFKSYKIERWNQVEQEWEDFATPIDVTGNTNAVPHHELTEELQTGIRLTIRGTFVADDDKLLTELILTSRIGRLDGWPVIKKPTISRSRVKTRMISGRYSMRTSIEAFSCVLSAVLISNAADLAIIEECYASNEGFLVWLSGGDETQFSSVRQGYRAKDIPLMQCSDEMSPEWYKGIYTTGIKVDMDLVEVVD